MAVFPEALPAGVPHHEPAGGRWALVPDLLDNTGALGADWKVDDSVSYQTVVGNSTSCGWQRSTSTPSSARFATHAPGARAGRRRICPSENPQRSGSVRLYVTLGGPVEERASRLSYSRVAATGAGLLRLDSLSPRSQLAAHLRRCP